MKATQQQPQLWFLSEGSSKPSETEWVHVSDSLYTSYRLYYILDSQEPLEVSSCICILPRGNWCSD